MARIRSFCLLFVVVLGVFMAGAWPAFSQGLDPQSLSGHWRGQWIRDSAAAPGGTISDSYALTIERVEGNQVYGQGDYDWKGKTQSFKFQGALDGNRLKYGRSIVTELEIVGDQMRGRATDGAKISLTRQAPGLAQPARDPSFTGEWRFGTGGILVLEQEGARLQGSFKQAYTDRASTCKGLFFDGTISGNKVNGNRYPCVGGTQPLYMTIVDANTLEMIIGVANQPTTTMTLKRIK
jgi:hypothetical protein